MTRNSSILLITAAASIELFYSVGDALAELKGIRIREDRLNNAVATISDPALEHQAGVDDGDLLNMSGPIGEAVEGQTVTSLRGIVEPSPREEASLVRGIAGVAQESFADSGLTGMDWPIEGLDKALCSPSVEAFRDEKRICFALRNDGGDVDALPAGCGSCRYPRRFLPGDSGARFGSLDRFGGGCGFCGPGRSGSFHEVFGFGGGAGAAGEEGQRVREDVAEGAAGAVGPLVPVEEGFGEADRVSYPVGEALGDSDLVVDVPLGVGDDVIGAELNRKVPV